MKEALGLAMHRACCEKRAERWETVRWAEAKWMEVDAMRRRGFWGRWRVPCSGVLCLFVNVVGRDGRWPVRLVWEVQKGQLFVWLHFA